ncbi:MAG TPA: hypothetical protein VGB41_07895, partial [Acidimicrobiia bacterium]
MTAPLAALVACWRARPTTPVPGHLVVPPPLRAFFLAGLAARAPGPVLAVVPGERDAEELSDDLELFTEHAVLLPAWETLPFEHVSPTIGTMASRAAARHALCAGPPGTVVVASVRAAVQRVSPSPVEPQVVRAGDTLDFGALVASLSATGYDRTDRVESRGEYA